MWIFHRDGFFSVIHDRSNARLPMVRARQRQHVERHFPDHEIHHSPSRDYRYRLTVECDEVATWLSSVASHETTAASTKTLSIGFVT